MSDKELAQAAQFTRFAWLLFAPLELLVANERYSPSLRTLAENIRGLAA